MVSSDEESESSIFRKKADSFVASTGLYHGSDVPRIFVNGHEFDFQRYVTVEKIVAAANEQFLTILQRDTYYGRIQDGQNVLDHLMEYYPDVVKRLPSPSFIEPRRFVSLHNRVHYELPLCKITVGKMVAVAI